MRITRTPFRISFLGGGSDYPEWYREHIGMVLGASINKYGYIIYQSNQEKYRILYSQLEEVDRVEEIRHQAIRAVLEYVQNFVPCSITYASDIHSRSGIGSSSAFVVGLLKSLVPDRSQDWYSSKATYIEQQILKEPVGSQDQILCAKGGINQIVWHPTGTTAIREIELSPERLQAFQSHLLLLYTHARPSKPSDTLHFPVKITQRLAQMAKEGADVLTSGDIMDFGVLLHEGWELKKQMSRAISDSQIDNLYQRAREYGAIGGKLLGSGGGGYMLLFAEPNRHQEIRDKLGIKDWVRFEFEFEGSKVVYED